MSILQPARLIFAESGWEPLTLMLPEAATQTFRKGQFVVVISGFVTEIAADPTLIAGMAADDARNTPSAGMVTVGVIPFSENTILEMNKVNTGGTAIATAVTDVGMTFGIFRDTGNRRVYAAAGSAAPRLICIGLSPKDPVGTTGGRLLLRVIGTFRQFASTSGG